MTLKYTLTVEGTEKEIIKHRRYSYKLIKEYELADEFEYFYDIEYKVVEPLKIEFTATADDLGGVELSQGTKKLQYMLGGAHAGKKFKVVITEEE
jgi:hypothetical protein